MPDRDFVIELASPAFLRPRYVQRVGHDGGFSVTTHPTKARRFAHSAATRSLADLSAAMLAGGWTGVLVPVAALTGAAS